MRGTPDARRDLEHDGVVAAIRGGEIRPSRLETQHGFTAPSDRYTRAREGAEAPGEDEAPAAPLEPSRWDGDVEDRVVIREREGDVFRREVDAGGEASQVRDEAESILPRPASELDPAGEPPDRLRAVPD